VVTILSLEFPRPLTIMTYADNISIP